MITGALIGQIILWLVVAVVVIAILYQIMTWLYRRSTKEIAFVRTGFLGEVMVIDGGAFVWPIVHDITPVNMNSLALAVKRERDQALITRDRIRVDVEAEFYVRVRPTRDAVSIAASTLGRRTLEPPRLHELLSGKFVSALRSVASEMTLEEMHEHRGDYVARVKALAQEGLSQNGLEMESVAIKDLDQTGLEFFNPSNRFDAEGLTRLIEDIEARRKARNDIEQDAVIRIRARNLQAEKEALEIERESEEARLAQQRDAEFRRARQRAGLVRERAERDTEAEQAQIIARERIEQERIANDRAVAEARIASELTVRQKEIARQQALDAAEIAAREATERARIEQERAVLAARIAQEQAVAAERIAAERATRELDITRQRAVQEAANRRKAVDVTMAQKEAEEAKLAADAAKIRAAVEAEAQRLINEAENVLTEGARASLFKRKLLDRVEGIVAASVKPLEKIEDIRIVQMDGLGGGGCGGGTPTDEVINSALRYRVQAPLIDSLLGEMGIDGANPARQGGLIREASDMARIAKDAAPAKPAPKKEG